MSGNFYVYLLRDPREADYLRSIFYVGKGTGTRPVAHRADALGSIEEWEDTSAADVESIRAKNERLRAIHEAGLVEEIDVLVGQPGPATSETTAFAVESALIEVLGHGQRKGLTNRVRGHGLRLQPATAFSVGTTAEEVGLPKGVAAVVVPVNGVWGGTDYAGTVLQASEDEIWENSRRTWTRFAADRQATIRARAGSDNPVLLLALAKDPGGHVANIVVGVFALASAEESTDPEDRKGGYWLTSDDGKRWVDEYPGWTMSRDAEAPELAPSLLHKVLTVDGIPLRRHQQHRYVGAW